MKSKFIKPLITFITLLLPFSTFSQVPGEKPTFPIEPSFVLVVVAGSLIVIAGFIYILAKNMSALFKMMMDKTKNNNLKIMVAVIGMATATPIFSSAQNATQPATNPAAESWYSTGNFMFLLLLVVYITLMIIVVWLSSYFMKMVREIWEKEKPIEAESIKISWWDKVLDSFNSSVPLNKETDIMLNHDYDGIKELDNSLPPWWLYGFYATIVFAVFYLFYYHMGGPGLSSTEAYAEEVRIANEQIAIMNKGTETTVDESNIQLLTDNKSLADAKSIFTNVCVACHGADGQGGAGPNLTDNYWIHGGDINSIYKLIKTGVADKGMPQWGATYKAPDLQKLTSYVMSLRGTNPANPKPPQGILYEQSGAKDSANAATDTIQKK